jgi:hypothetical protein
MLLHWLQQVHQLASCDVIGSSLEYGISNLVLVSAARRASARFLLRGKLATRPTHLLASPPLAARHLFPTLLDNTCRLELASQVPKRCHSAATVYTVRHGCGTPEELAAVRVYTATTVDLFARLLDNWEFFVMASPHTACVEQCLGGKSGGLLHQPLDSFPA